MNEDYVIEVKHITKTFQLAKSQSLKGTLVDKLKGRRNSKTTFNALQDVSFSVKRGEIFGIIGVNGAGKSTLFSIIAGTMYPTSGRVKTVGVVSSLLELGAGFHSELTGRENIFLYGSIMGIPKKRMAERFDKIVEFAGLKKFIDQPVKHYSSGMYVRLGFAVAVEVDPDILLIDEVLAVGDINFQKKCLAKLDEFKAKGKTMLIISHDIGVIQRISDRVMVLDAGRIYDLGEPGSMVDKYEVLSVPTAEWGNKAIRFKKVILKNSDGEATDTIKSGATLHIEVSYEVSEEVSQPVFGFSLLNTDGRILQGSNTQIEGVSTGVVTPGQYSYTLTFESFALAHGTYYLSLSAHSQDHLVNYHRISKIAAIKVQAPENSEGDVYLKTSWSI